MLIDSFTFWFKLPYSGPMSSSRAKNLKSAFQYMSALKEKISKEVELGRIAGPFSFPPLANFKMSPVGLIPKQDGSWRLITHLSYPLGQSVNDGVDKAFTEVTYTSFDKVVDMIFRLGKSALMAKRDIKSAFRLLPIYPGDFHLLGIKVGDQYYYDKCMPMGLNVSCALWEKVAKFLHWRVSNITAGLHTFVLWIIF